MKKIKINKKVLMAIVALLLAGGALAYYLLVGGDSNVDRMEENTANHEQSDSQVNDNDVEQEDTNKEELSGSPSGEGSVTPTPQEPNTTPPSSQWSTSETGEITVQSPPKNSTLEDGDALSGTSELSSVSFRLIDNVSGVIARGELDVNEGNFSGTFNFETSATEGRLDIFGTKSDGEEFSNIEIPVKF